jgi:hypothetical protein
LALVYTDKRAMTSSVANHRKPLEAARFQRDRGFGFQPNISSHQRCSVESKQDKAALKSYGVRKVSGRMTFGWKPNPRSC